MQFRITTMLSCTLALLIVAPANAEARDSDRVLLVVSGYGADDGKTRPGFEMDELSQAYAVFSDNGLQVDIASPSGGAVVADKFNRNKPYNSRFLSDSNAVAKLTSTRAISNLGNEKYAAIFVIGGKGAMFDLPVSADLKALLARTYEEGGVIGAVCHGPAVLMNLPLKNGSSLLEGRAVTGFSNEEEALFGKGWAPSFPVLLESGLRGSGAKFSEAPMMLNHVVTDGRLVTGQNPYSTADAAEAVVKAMGRPLAPRQPWADERSVELISQMLSGDKGNARASFNADPTLYDVPLIAMWGFFRAQSAGSDREALTNAVEVMELALPHFSRPELVAGIAEARSKLSKMQ
ncbi:type 1 glutamine amidotransferase domain-containing protein [Sphingorhabdus pulchriflava]|uniref:Type 1 glutamine amidotransferase domain-containing protein n=1 Tax=Sphingorhabdus pulchriflava TaxID=2292257 RepID=A0A371BI14_9SPHN|nr:type 1 glutamine amidotransferase domain-containing protein [Sphingorhabdus pulchriflava]RDV07219.1 type 1 glutamine amidotransferase domain-containing protein [Sphingorhabdus pulchriflava]